MNLIGSSPRRPDYYGRTLYAYNNYRSSRTWIYEETCTV